MSDPLAMWEVQYSWAPPGKTYRAQTTCWVLTTSALQAIRLVIERSSTGDDTQVHQVIRRTHDTPLIDWYAIDKEEVW